MKLRFIWHQRKRKKAPEIPCYKEERAGGKGKRLNHVYKGHFNVFESPLLNNACFSSVKIKQTSSLLLKKLNCPDGRRLQKLGQCEVFIFSRWVGKRRTEDHWGLYVICTVCV